MRISSTLLFIGLKKKRDKKKFVHRSKIKNLFELDTGEDFARYHFRRTRGTKKKVRCKRDLGRVNQAFSGASTRHE
jgi:hypothetical protein